MNTHTKVFTHAVMLLLSKEQFRVLQNAYAKHVETFTQDETAPTRAEFVRTVLLKALREILNGVPTT